MNRDTVKKILKGVAIVTLALAIVIGGKLPKPVNGNGDNHIQYTQK